MRITVTPFTPRTRRIDWAAVFDGAIGFTLLVLATVKVVDLAMSPTMGVGYAAWSAGSALAAGAGYMLTARRVS